MDKFLSTLSLRRATSSTMHSAHSTIISIHALLAESDCCRLYCAGTSLQFLSTLSLRRATAGTVPEHCEGVFLSTLSLRRATCGKHRDRPHGRISIHALLAESDKFFYHPVHIPLLFLSTLSLRRATVRSSLTLSPSLFLSTLSLRRATYIPLVRYLLPGISIHALLAESDWNALAFLF